ncbi:MAG TPA: DUF456 family protein [Stenomitos sp.]
MPTSLLSFAYPLALVLMIVGLVLSVRRMTAGFALVGLTAVGYGLWQAYGLDWQLSTAGWVQFGLIVALTALGLSLETISERLHLRLGWIGQNTVWGGLIGGMVALFLFGGALAMLLGVLVGTVAVQFSGRRAQRFDRALIDGLEGFFAMFGSVGLRVILAVVVIDLLLGLAGAATGHIGRF